MVWRRYSGLGGTQGLLMVYRFYTSIGSLKRGGERQRQGLPAVKTAITSHQPALSRALCIT